MEAVERHTEIEDFIHAAGWGEALRAPVAQDVSSRNYLRLHQNGRSAILMDAPVGEVGETPRFVEVNARLAEAGLSVPRIFEANPARGLVLMEDFGTARIAEHLEAQPEDEVEIYQAIARMLPLLRAVPHDGLPEYDRSFALDEAALALQWCLPETLAKAAPELDMTLRAELHMALEATDAPRCFVMRDMHAQNLFWLPARSGPARVGIIDHQGARAGAPAYDLVSLATDARRDVGPQARSALAGAARLVAPEAFNLWSFQRNMKILGIFARAAHRDGRRAYLALLPRVADHVEEAVQDPLLNRLAPLTRQVTDHARRLAEGRA